jgi:hypothetical protein
VLVLVVDRIAVAVLVFDFPEKGRFSKIYTRMEPLCIMKCECSAGGQCCVPATTSVIDEIDV